LLPSFLSSLSSFEGERDERSRVFSTGDVERSRDELKNQEQTIFKTKLEVSI